MITKSLTFTEGHLYIKLPRYGCTFTVTFSTAYKSGVTILTCMCVVGHQIVTFNSWYVINYKRLATQSNHTSLSVS